MPANAPIRIIDPLTPAFQHLKAVLFKPFNLERWLAIGFCAWLAALGQGGCGGGPGNLARSQNRINKTQDDLPQVKQWVVDNLSWLIPVGIGVAVLALAVWLLMIWLSSRGQFMFLHCVAQNRAEVRAPWSAYATHGNSLFKFRLVLSFTAGAVFLLSLVLLAILVYSMISTSTAPAGRILGATCVGLGAIAIGCTLVIVMKLTKDFVVPIMVLRQSKCLAAWKEFSALFQAHVGSFILYLLWCLVMTAGIGVLVLCLVFVTCCIGGVILAIPYVGTVLLLPVPVLLRAYSLHFLAQFGPEYNVMALPPATVSGS